MLQFADGTTVEVPVGSLWILLEEGNEMCDAGSLGGRRGIAGERYGLIRVGRRSAGGAVGLR